MTPKTFLTACGNTLKDIVFPEGALCQCCGKLSDGCCLCPSCRKALHASDGLSAWHRTDIAGVPVFSMRPHRGIPRTLVIRLKHGACACIADILADLVLPLPEGVIFSPDTVVTWVPMPDRRRLERCIDHGQVLAAAIADRLHLQSRCLLIRRDQRRHTQEGLDREERMANLRNAYIPAGKISFPVLLVDDVTTTGSTCRSCIEALRAGGAEKITAVTVTYVP